MAVKGSEQYQSIVIRYRPRQRFWWLLAALAIFFSFIAISAWLTNYLADRGYQQLVVERDELRNELVEARAVATEAEQRLINQQLGSEVDRQSVEEVRQLLRDEKKKIAALNEEIRFYKGLMSPTELVSGLGIRAWEIYATDVPGVYQYKLLMQQLAVKHRLLKGKVAVNLVAKSDDKQQRHNLAALSDQVKSSEITLRFKYFQSIEGELSLPEGFVPEWVEVVASASSPKTVKLEKNYDWLVQGSE